MNIGKKTSLNKIYEPQQLTLKKNKNNWKQDPDNWVWGLFYYNPEDKRIFPPKRIKEFGWTINFANPNSVFLCVVLILVLMILSESIK